MNKLGRVISGILVVIAVGATLTTCFGGNNNSGSGGTESKKPINSGVTHTSVPAQGSSNDISVTRQDGLKFILTKAGTLKFISMKIMINTFSQFP